MIIARIINVGGYDGLPDRFLVESTFKFGWIAKDGFSRELGNAVAFRTQAEAERRFKELFPRAAGELKTDFI